MNRGIQRASSPQPSPPGEEREKTQWACDDLAPSPREERAGRGLGRGAAPGFMVPMHAKNRKEAFHEPSDVAQTSGPTRGPRYLGTGSGVAFFLGPQGFFVTLEGFAEAFHAVAQAAFVKIGDGE